MPPTVSVIMAVHNGERWLGEALESLVTQTYRDFDILVADDGSTDGTLALLQHFDHEHLPSLHWYHWESQRGLATSLNVLIRNANTPFLARMDADDLSHPSRLAKQVAFLLAFPEVGLLGTGATTIDEEGHVIEEYRPPVTDAEIRRALKTRNPFVHASVMMRRDVVEAVGGYDESFTVAQDYDLWARLATVTQLANLREPLVSRRLHAAGHGQASGLRADRLRAEAIIRLKQGVNPIKQVVGLLGT